MTTTKMLRSELVAALRQRDGDTCQHPDCGKTLDFTLEEGPLEATLDHSYPMSRARAEGWTEDAIWALENLTLMHRRCNARKGDLVYNEDGTLPEKPQSRFRRRRDKRAARQGLCSTCYSGRILLVGEVCPDCGSGPQPSYPTAYQAKSSECPHEGPWSCFACIVGIVDRKPAYVEVFDIENSGIDE